MRKRPEESRLTVGSPVVLDPHAVRMVIAHIGGDGAAGLDPQALIELGLPAAFVERFVEMTRVGDMVEVYVEVAAPDTRLPTVWSLALLRGLMDHYALDRSEPDASLSRNARVLSAQLLEYLDQHDQDTPLTENEIQTESERRAFIAKRLGRSLAEAFRQEVTDEDDAKKEKHRDDGRQR
jgi:hypothetical protein